MEIDYTKSICGKCIHKKDVKGMGAKDLLGRSSALLFDGSFCKKANCWIPEMKDGEGKIHSDVSECDGFEGSEPNPPKKIKIPYQENKNRILIPSPGKGKAIKLCDDGIHYEIIKTTKDG